jgi:hypothetical protein
MQSKPKGKRLLPRTNICVCCVTSSATPEALPASVETIAASLGFNPAERRRLSGGEIVAINLPETNAKMLSQTVAMVMPASIEQIVVQLRRGNILETDRDVIAFGRIEPENIDQSLKFALYTAGDSEEINLLRNSKFDSFNLSAAEIATLNPPDDPRRTPSPKFIVKFSLHLPKPISTLD